jgi:hypothetical protein
MEYLDDNDDEINVEKYIAEISASLPLNDAEACRQICAGLPGVVEYLLEYRQKRHASSPDH